MRMLILPIIMFMASILPVSCQNRNSVIDIVPKADTLFARSVRLDVEVFSPSSMIVCDNTLLMPVRKMPKAFQLVPLPLTENTFQAGPLGRGPMDFLNVDFSGIKALPEGFVVSDAYGIKKCHIEGRDIVVDEKDPTLAGNASNGLTSLEDGYIDMATGSTDYEFILYSKAGRFNKHVSKMPKFSKAQDVEPVFLYMKKWTVKPDQKRVAVFYCHFDRMKIMDMSGRVVKEMETDLGYSRKAEDDMSRICYNGISSVTDEYIPVLHQNDIGAEVQIWNWEGELIKRFVVLEGASCFAIDWETMKLYFSTREVENTIFEAEISL